MEKNIKINAIVIDDEPGCITNLLHYLQKCAPEVNVIATGNSLDAVLCTISQHIDVAFLDVEIFDDNIFNALAATHDIDFKIVFVTAYEKYAIRAWKVEAFDYILKPLSEDDISGCVQKLHRHLHGQRAKNNIPGKEVKTDPDKKIIIRHSDKIHILKANDILYVTGNGFYSTITFIINNEERDIIISKPLNKIVQQYGSELFFRIHKSFIVNKNRIVAVVKDDGVNVKMANHKILPVAKRRINDFLSFLNATN